ncbi:MAG: response regulator transcription factor [Vulcanimicrobiota bacterium]
MTGICSESRVLLVDDHPVYREGLKKILDSHARLRVVAEASSLSEALELLRRESVQVLITDLCLVDGSGHQLLEQARLIQPRLRSMVLSVSRQSGDIVQAIQAGASAYLTKSSTRDEILKALEEILQGRCLLQADCSSGLGESEIVQGAVVRAGLLTGREKDVLNFLRSGLTPREIAAKLELSMTTVRTHVRNLYRKLKVSTRTQLMLKTMPPKA